MSQVRMQLKAAKRSLNAFTNSLFLTTGEPFLSLYSHVIKILITHKISIEYVKYTKQKHCDCTNNPLLRFKCMITY